MTSALFDVFLLVILLKKVELQQIQRSVDYDNLHRYYIIVPAASSVSSYNDAERDCEK